MADLETGRDSGERIQKFLARCGVGSRRFCDSLVAQGRVKINGRVARPGDMVFRGDNVMVDGIRVRPLPLKYYMVNKPGGYVCSNVREGGRKRVIDLLPDANRYHLFTAGRLDIDTTGLIIVTNDGDFAHRITHPRFGIEKEYIVEITPPLDLPEFSRFERGITINSGPGGRGRVRVRGWIKKTKNLGKHREKVWIVVHEGRFRMVRQMMEKTGHRVLSLHRIRIGPLSLGKLPLGGYRELKKDIIRRFFGG